MKGKFFPVRPFSPLTMLERSSILLIDMNKLPVQKRTAVVAALVEGNSIRATCRMTGVAKGTVLKLLVDLGKACERYQRATLVNLKCRRIQCDEIWAFCYAKKKNVPESMRGLPGVGDVWTWTAMDADTKLIISWLVGERDAGYATEFINDVASRVATRIQLTTDGLRAYLEAVEGAFGADVDYAQLVKMYGDPPRLRPATALRRVSGHGEKSSLASRIAATSRLRSSSDRISPCG